jgi:hypothetical protein
MVTSAEPGLTDSQATAFFLCPQEPLHRQYEALRAFFVEHFPSAEAAQLFGYSAGSFRVLCHQFRHDPEKRSAFFRLPPRGARPAPARDPVRELVVAMRKRNLSVYDIQRDLAGTGHRISINALTVLLREEGFARLPRRRDEERPATLTPDSAEIADVRQLDLSPRSFRTTAAGLFLFLPLLVSVAAKKGTNLAGEKEPVVGLRSGLRRAQKWGSGDCFLLSSRIVHPFGQRGAISLAGDLENDRPFDQPIEESHRQRAIGHVVSPFVEVDVGHQGGGALLVA